MALETIIVLLAILWAAGLIVLPAVGWLLNALIVIVVILVLLRIIRGEKLL